MKRTWWTAERRRLLSEVLRQLVEEKEIISTVITPGKDEEE